MSVICHPYAECDTQGESWESIFKRLLVLDENGNLAIRACCCDVVTEEEEEEEPEQIL